MGFVAVFAVWRLGARAWWFGLTHAREGVGCRLWESDVRVMGGDRVGTRLGGAHAPLWTSLDLPIRAARAAGNLSRALGRCGANPGAVEICRSRAARVAS